jgi:hypothetical protein
MVEERAREGRAGAACGDAVTWPSALERGGPSAERLPAALRGRAGRTGVTGARWSGGVCATLTARARVLANSSRASLVGPPAIRRAKALPALALLRAA